jgi:hypothetical protein
MRIGQPEYSRMKTGGLSPPPFACFDAPRSGMDQVQEAGLQPADALVVQVHAIGAS